MAKAFPSQNTGTQLNLGYSRSTPTETCLIKTSLHCEKYQISLFVGSSVTRLDFSERSCIKYCYKSSPNISKILGYYEKCPFLSKNWYGLYWAILIYNWLLFIRISSRTVCGLCCSLWSKTDWKLKVLFGIRRRAKITSSQTSYAKTIWNTDLSGIDREIEIEREGKTERMNKEQKIKDSAPLCTSFIISGYFGFLLSYTS